VFETQPLKIERVGCVETLSVLSCLSVSLVLQSGLFFCGVPSGSKGGRRWQRWWCFVVMVVMVVTFGVLFFSEKGGWWVGGSISTAVRESKRGRCFGLRSWNPLFPLFFFLIGFWCSCLTFEFDGSLHTPVVHGLRQLWAKSAAVIFVFAVFCVCSLVFVIFFFFSSVSALPDRTRDTFSVHCGKLDFTPLTLALIWCVCVCACIYSAAAFFFSVLLLSLCCGGLAVMQRPPGEPWPPCWGSHFSPLPSFPLSVPYRCMYAWCASVQQTLFYPLPSTLLSVVGARGLLML
jgi:hypothetical protein